jgi:FtsZ-binding cell division protein ZapB
MEATALSPLPEEDALASLEERIRRAAELVATLRSERDAAVAELEAVKRSAGSALVDSQKMRQEIDTMRGERKQVRTRIEKLLGQMELL